MSTTIVNRSMDLRSPQIYESIDSGRMRPNTQRRRIAFNTLSLQDKFKQSNENRNSITEHDEFGFSESQSMVQVNDLMKTMTIKNTKGLQ